MKTKLLKKLRRIGKNKITIYSVTTTGNIVTGMSIGYNEDAYSGLFNFGNTEEQVLKKAEDVYLNNNIDLIRKRYKKYSVKYK